MNITNILWFFCGLGLLIVGAEALVRGSSRLARLVGLSPLVVGLTVVAFGTSSPELAVSIKAALGGQADLSLGNVVGSNIFNVLFILGLCSLLTPLTVAQQLIRFDIWVMVIVSCALLLLGLDGSISRVDGAFLFAALIAYTAWIIHQSRKQQNNALAAEYSESQDRKSGPERGKNWLVNTVLVIVGLGALVIGARWMVSAAVAFAEAFGISELVIGLTIVAAGTSMPEVAASIVAGFRGERDIAVGNVVGSNIFNILGVIGLAAMISPTGVAVTRGPLEFDIPVMVAVAFGCIPIFFSGLRIARWEGALFLGYYAAYTGYLAMKAQGHEYLGQLRTAMLWYVIPLTAVTLLVMLVRGVRKQQTAI